MFTRKFIFCFILATLPFLSLSAQDNTEAKALDSNSKVVIVLDASGSMWGQINNKAKITIAKEVVSGIVTDLNPEMEIGLTVYGHRKKGDCEDIETLIPVTKINKVKFNNTLKTITPKGKTPLSKAVMMAADELRYTEEKATVVLVSDGIETCDLNPCDVGTNLEKSGVDFTAHVIGFDIQDEEAKKQLTCLAENTGGKFMAASDASSLKLSLEEAVKEVKKPSPNIQFKAVHEEGGEYVKDVYWNIYKTPDSELDDLGKRIISGRGDTPKYNLIPGSYIAVVKSNSGKATARKTIEVTEGSPREIEVILAVEGIVKLSAVHTAGDKPLENMYWNVYTISDNELEEGQRVNFGGGTSPEYKLLPGKYRATVKSSKGKAKAEKIIEVIAGKKRTEEIVISEEGIVELVAVNSEGGTPLENMYWGLYTIGEDSKKKDRIDYGGGNKPKYRVLPGKYIATVKSSKGKAKTEQEIEVLAGKKQRIEVLMPQEGIIQLLGVNKAGGNPLKQLYWNLFTIVPEDSIEDPVSVQYGGGASPSYKLLPGKYLAKVRSTKGKAKTEQVVEVIAGKKIKVEVLLPEEGAITLSLVRTPGGTPLGSVYWQLYTKVAEDSLENPVTVHSGGGKTPTYKALPGTYTVIAKVSKPEKMSIEKEVTIIAGKAHKIEIVITDEE